MRQYVAETIGTFVLSLVVILSTSANAAFPIATPPLAALALGLFVYSVGHMSGAHLNPAITVGLLVVDKIKFRPAAYYIVSQFIGVYTASFVAKYTGAVASIVTQVEPLPQHLLAEGLGTAVFAFGIASVVRGRAPEQMRGLVVGGSLLLGIAISVMTGGFGILNPAVAYGLNIFTSAYIFGPIIGSIVGFIAYQVLDAPVKKQK